MSKYCSFLLFILFFPSVNFILNCQETDQGLKNITDKFSEFCKTIPYEDIYLHSDRDVYIAGEYLWFSAYLFDHQNSSLSSNSSYAYAELLNSDNQRVSQTSIPLKNGSGNGGFVLPDTLRNGDYTLRAYTNWMKNFLPAGCFMKTITVFNILNEKHSWNRNASGLTDNKVSAIDFYPEGGKILSGFKNRIGLKVYNKRGQLTGGKVFLVNLTDNTRTIIIVDSTGSGSFEFIPETGKNYKLEAENSNSAFFLPPIYERGLSLHVNTLGSDILEFTINTDQTTISGNNNFIWVIVRSGGRIMFSKKVFLKERSTIITIPPEKLNPGINQIIIFDSGTNPVCDRYVFKSIPETKNISLKTGNRFRKKAKISLELDLDSNIFLYDAPANFSLSVSALNSNMNLNEIDDYLILGNEFFSGKDSKRPHADFWKSSVKSIDDYLLTVKSNWIDWRKIMSGIIPAIRYGFEKDGRILYGNVKNLTNNESNQNKLVFLSAPDKIPVFRYAMIDPESRFSFFIPDNEQVNDLIIQPADSRNNYSLIIESPYMQKYPESVGFSDTGKVSISDEIIKWSINYQVDKIYGISSIGDTVRSNEIPAEPVRFYGKPDQELYLKDYISLPTMQEVFFELIPGVILKTSKSKSGILIQDPVSRRFNANPPSLFVDGVIIEDPSVIANLDPELVEEIDVIKSEYIVGHVIFNGIINVITKTGDFRAVPLPKNFVRFTFKVHDTSFRFKVQENSPDDKKIPDFRNTLFWNPDLKPDKNGKILVEINASDFISDYLINFQGTSGGKHFSVKKNIRVE
jgi:hypothetical protein